MTSYSAPYLFPDEPPQNELLRRRLQPPSRKAGWMSFDEFLTWAAANNKPPRPIGYFEQNPPGQSSSPRPTAANPRSTEFTDEELIASMSRAARNDRTCDLLTNPSQTPDNTKNEPTAS